MRVPHRVDGFPADLFLTLENKSLVCCWFKQCFQHSTTFSEQDIKFYSREKTMCKRILRIITFQKKPTHKLLYLPPHAFFSLAQTIFTFHLLMLYLEKKRDTVQKIINISTAKQIYHLFHFTKKISNLLTELLTACIF